MRRVPDSERRARLGVRHAVAPAHRADDPVAAARAVVALHGTDPATTVLSVLARSGAAISDVESSLYEVRSLIRVLAMRRTVFAVPHDEAPHFLAGASDVVARQQRTLLGRLLVDSAVTDDPESWLAAVVPIAIAAIEAAGEVTSAQLSQADARLAARLEVGQGAYAASPTVASRLLTMLSAEGSVVRARPRGGWTSTQFRWSTLDAWRPGLPPRPSSDEAAAWIAEAWLRRYGPATADDLQWWTGWTKTRTRAALAAIATTGVELEDGRPALVVAGDDAPVPAPDPWVALLPALDPSAMGWKGREFLLGDHRPHVYDVNGNAGPTVWCDGRIVGGWAQRDDGEVVVQVLEDIGTEATAALAVEADRLRQTLGDVRLKARARGWTPIERTLRG